jgi:hypothetical protein
VGQANVRPPPDFRGAPIPADEIPHPRAIVPNIRVAETEHWYGCGPRPAVLQGWKLYVPLTLTNATATIRRLLPVVTRAGLHCKYIRSIKLLRKLNSGMFGYTQIGKCFVIYLPKVHARIVNTIKKHLVPLRDECPEVPCAVPFGDGLPLYYRYGAYTGDQITLGSESIGDSREDAAAGVPDGVEDVLAAFTTPVVESKAVRRLLLRYPVFEALRQQGKCGIFLGFRLASGTFEQVVLKVGYHRGQVQPDGSDGCTFLRRELRFYRLLSRRALAGVAPRLIDSLDRPRKVILVLEHIYGESLLDCKLAGNLPVKSLDQCWEILVRLHKAGLYLGDAKIANFIRGRDGAVRVLDFEAAGRVGEPPPAVKTFDTTPTSADPCQSDRLHFLASVLYPYESGKYSWEDRRVDLHVLCHAAPDSPAARWAARKLRQVLTAASS